MKMKNRLATVGPAVGNKAEALVVNTQFAGNLGCGNLQMPGQIPMLGSHIAQAGHMFLWNQQNMDRRLGVNVLEGQHVIIFEYLIARHNTLDNLAENAVAHNRPPRVTGTSLFILSNFPRNDYNLRNFSSA